MIKLESAHIEEFRGIKRLDIDFKQSTFAVSGPNGSGKSGVIDAIEFGLTGQIGRLSGTGTQGLSVTEHGPHVDKAKFPDAAFVELTVFIPNLKKSATITRKISAPKKPKITPNDVDVKAALADVAEHPEIALSRRELLRFILVEPSRRSEEIQSLLKLDDIGKLRSALNSAQRKLQSTDDDAAANLKATEQALQSHLQIASLKPEEILAVVNQRRSILNLDDISILTPDTRLDTGFEKVGASEFNKQSALRDLRSLIEAQKRGAKARSDAAAELLSAYERLESDPNIGRVLAQKVFLEQGQELIASANCPFCDIAWDSEAHLREHITAKIAQSREAETLVDALQKNGSLLAAEVKQVDQVPALPSGAATENGKFFAAARAFANGSAPPRRVRVYEKLQPNIWTYNGVFHLVDAWLQQSGARKVFKFKLVAVEGDENLDEPAHADAPHRRLIPSWVKREVFKRDGGKCVLCHSDKNLHYDHDLPFSKGGSSLTPENIRLLCGKHNLQKNARIE